jgi:MEDS: MEthanogen/methylotroph, DcmR Sensory domain
MPWGTHVCIFYETPQNLLDTAVSYFTSGLEGNEFCVWAVSESITKRPATHALRPAFAISIGIWPTGGSRSSMDATGISRAINLTCWSEKLAGALTRGYDGIRVSDRPSADPADLLTGVLSTHVCTCALPEAIGMVRSAPR